VIKKTSLIIFTFSFLVGFFSGSLHASVSPYASVSSTVNINLYFPETMVSENETVNLKIDLVDSIGVVTYKTLLQESGVTLNGRFLNKVVGGVTASAFSTPDVKFKITLSNRTNSRPDVSELIPVYSVPYALLASQVEMPLVINAIHGLQGYLDVLVTPNGILDIQAATINVGGITILDDGSDYAERFYFSDKPVIQPGMVVVIDPSASDPGTLKQSTTAYDKRVVGVVSGANNVRAGTVIGQGDYPVALSGIVWVYCDARDASIQPGDWLASSNTPGHAMKAVDTSRGGIIGKAMTSLNRGEKNLVLMLVSLQ